MRIMLRAALGLAVLSVAVLAQERITFEGQQAIRLSNDKLQLIVYPQGGAMADLTFVGQGDSPSPLWNPIRLAREAKLNPPTGFYRGHFVCVDGFGPASAEERAAGLPMHGEAQTLPWTLESYESRDGSATAKFSVRMPMMQEVLTRTYSVVRGENVVWIDSELENLLAFDRPVFWGEHATIAAPFLEPGKVFVDMPVQKAKTKAYQPIAAGAAATRQLRSFVDFDWPMAPTLDGKRFDLRSAPMPPGTLEHSTSLLDTSRRLAFVTGLNVDRKLLIGWVFRREEFPWVQTWLSYPGVNRMTRGLEFATQPFDLPRAEVLKSGPLFDTPVFRMLPAKSKITSSFLMFYTAVPDGFKKVDDVRLEGGTMIIEDRQNARSVRLAVGRTL